ncbi:MAG: GGDEF domain-containing protein [Clostridia bacterium]|nr:GGDEF domain-containing protein [Clostridia bacterium]
MKHKSIILVSFIMILAMISVLTSTLFFDALGHNAPYSSEDIVSEISYIEGSQIPFESIEKSSEEFTPLSDQPFLSRFIHNDYWIRFKIDPMGDFKYLQLNLNSDHAELYFPVDHQETYRHINSPVQQISSFSSNLVMEVPKSISYSDYVYIKTSCRNIPSNLIYLYTSKELMNALSTRNISLGIFFGILFAILFYNVIIFILFQDRIFIFIIGFLIPLLLYLIVFSFTGYHKILLMLLALTIIFATVFVKLFLKTKELCIKIDYILTAIIGLVIFLTLISVLTDFILIDPLISVIRFIIPILFTFISIKCYLKGNGPAQFFGFGWACITFGIIFYALSIEFRWISLPYYFILTSITFAVMLFSFSTLFNRMRSFMYQKTKLDKNMRFYHKLSIIDELTQLYNRRKLFDIFKVKMQEAREEKTTLSVAMFDLDNFKSINDQYGHLAGDLIIRELSSTIKDNIRYYDFAFRYGGEELLVLLYDADQVTATFICERIRKSFIAKKYEEIDGNNVTVSIGVSTLLPDDTADILIQRADDALYMAKSNGKNQTCTK